MNKDPQFSTIKSIQSKLLKYTLFKFLDSNISLRLNSHKLFQVFWCLKQLEMIILLIILINLVSIQTPFHLKIRLLEIPITMKTLISL